VCENKSKKLEEILFGFGFDCMCVWVISCVYVLIVFVLYGMALYGIVLRCIVLCCIELCCIYMIT